MPNGRGSICLDTSASHHHLIKAKVHDSVYKVASQGVNDRRDHLASHPVVPADRDDPSDDYHALVTKYVSDDSLDP